LGYSVNYDIDSRISYRSSMDLGSISESANNVNSEVGDISPSENDAEKISKRLKNIQEKRGKK
jgi:hypothetical protein